VKRKTRTDGGGSGTKEAAATPSGNYQSSRVFGKLKDLQEKISSDESLTTPQYLRLYDDLLDKAVLPIIANSRFFDSYLIRILGWQEKNFRRKVSFLKRVEFPRLAMNFLLQSTCEGREKAYRELHLDRLLKAQLVSAFHHALSNYLKACNLELEVPVGTLADKQTFCLRVKEQVENALRASDSSSLLVAYHESKRYAELASEFKRMIMEKYVRLCLNTARKDYMQYFNCRVKLDDIVQTYILAMSRAIDKCDARQGALTSHIQNWFFSARDAVAKGLDRKVAISESELEMSTVEEGGFYSKFDSYESLKESEANLRVIAEVARIADPLGAARAFLGVPENLTPAELQLLLKARFKNVPAK